MTDINLCQNCGWVTNGAKIIEWAPKNWYCTNPNCYLNQFFDYKNFEPTKENTISKNIYLCVNNC